MDVRPLLGTALLGLCLTACTALGGSEELGGGGEPTFELVSATPRDGLPSASVTATIALTFNVPIDESSVTASTISVSPTTLGAITIDGSTLTFDPWDDLLPATTYVFSISPELKGSNGKALGVMANPYGFKTGGIPQDTLPTQGPRPR